MARKEFSLRHIESEAEAQRIICAYLNTLGLLYCHVPNEGKRSKVLGYQMRQLGLSAGVPDLLIFDRPPAKPDCPGVALEMKRGKGGRVTELQQGWLTALRARGWEAHVCHGSGEAIKVLSALGYGAEVTVRGN